MLVKFYIYKSSFLFLFNEHNTYKLIINNKIALKCYIFKIILIVPKHLYV